MYRYSKEHIALALGLEILDNREEILRNREEMLRNREEMLGKMSTILQHWDEALQKQEARERELVVSEISTNVAVGIIALVTGLFLSGVMRASWTR